MLARCFAATICLLALLLAVAACAREARFSADTVGMRHVVGPQQPVTLPPVRVNIYLQSTADMVYLLGTNYDTAINILRGVANSLWIVRGVQQYLYRFDVAWLEDERTHPAYRGMAFAYPLDPIRPGGIYERQQVNYILDADFYCLEWYTKWSRRGGELYRARIDGSPPFVPLEMQHLSRTLNEISHLRQGSNEITIMVTNFVGRNPADNTAAHDHIANRLRERPDQSVALFAFQADAPIDEQEDRVLPFYVLILGQTDEVVEFSDSLNRQLRERNIDHIYNLYIQGFTALPHNRRISTNANTEVVQTKPGVRKAFASDFSDSEEALFSRYFTDGGRDTRMVYTVYRRLISDNMARLEFYVHDLPIPQALLRYTSLQAHMEILPAAGSTAILPRNSDISAYLVPGENTARVSVAVDTRDLERPQRAALAIRLYAGLHMDIAPLVGRSDFVRGAFDALGAFAQNMQRSQEINRQLMGEIYVYLIYR